MDDSTESLGNSTMMFWIIIACAVGFALCVLGALVHVSRRRNGEEESQEYYDEDVEQYYHGGGSARGSRSSSGRGTRGHQRKRSHRAMFYEGGDDHVVPPDYLFVERGHDQHRMVRDRQAEINLMNRLYGDRQPNQWL